MRDTLSKNKVMVLCTEGHRNTQGGGCDMEIRMPENAKKVIETLEAAGYEAYIVGG